MTKEAKRILVGTPMFGGQCFGAFTQSLLHLQRILNDDGYIMDFMYTGNESLITQARNEIAHVFMRDNFDYLLFIDGDHRFDPNGILRMIEEDEAIICGVCPKKLVNWKMVSDAAKMGASNLEFFTGSFAIETLDNTKVRIDEKFEIKRGGTGIMLIKREVFERLKPSQNTFKSNYGDHQTVEYFKTFVKDGILLSEDFGFCNEWRELGGKVYAAPWIAITHIGNYEFKGTLKAVSDLDKRREKVKITAASR
jgi:hypothetical protein